MKCSSSRIIGRSKVMGHFCYTPPDQVVCDGDACVIAGSESVMQHSLEALPEVGVSGGEMIKKTRFGEILQGLEQGGAYAFDEVAYQRFLAQAKRNALHGLPPVHTEGFEGSPTGMHFIRIQWFGGY